MIEPNSAASLSALLSAAARAAHELVDRPPHLLQDPDARALCALFEPSPLSYQLAQPEQPVLATARISTAARAGFARAALERSGLTQLVLLGAGLDSSVSRGFEIDTWVVDRPEVLAWRAELFGQAGITDAAHPVPADLAADDLLPALAAAGLDVTRPVFVAALGLVMYLTDGDLQALLGRLAPLPGGSRLVVDSIVPAALRDQAGRAYADAITGSIGGREPWHCTPHPDQLAGWLQDAGWRPEQLPIEADWVPEPFWAANPQLGRNRLSVLVEAVRC
ncbi:methyltransferase (TIGR00027 family) [Propionicimonas paludicola]|uniref:S-adenosyl-L-methionine-dependent methyltransferase n=1 Tax=Propionicimonas paludicola TaxID=185243 RepID=A0A2A9CSZ9_9ACTN|nr:SAM-dependent methyltransferase [Propionicimonas paludicola]PFG17256.1 methyltransferase (TIGR00027 family) [Propionicimonas paludicola]